MKKLVFLIPILLLVACSNETPEVAINENNENKIEETKETIKDLGSDIKNEVMEKKNDKDLFTFDRPVFTNPTGTKWELTSTISCTIDLNEYPSWVKDNLDYLLEINRDAYRGQPINSMIDLVENYKLYGDQIKWDMAADKVIITDGMSGSQKYNMNYLHGICPAAEVKINNQNLLSKIRYTDVYLSTDPSNKEFSNSIKYKWVYFDDDIKPKQKSGISWYSPETKDFYGDYDVANYFICDLENTGKAYLCSINENHHTDFGMWAELENNCFINIMCTHLIKDVIEKLTLSCPIGYFKRIETYEELQEWMYLYSSIWNNYVAEVDIPNAKEKSIQNPSFTNRQWITRHSNKMRNYFSINNGWLIDDEFFVAENEDISRELLNGCVIHPEEKNNYIQAIIDCEKDKFRWDFSNKIYGLSGVTVLQKEFGGTWYDYDFINATNETFKYMDRVNNYLNKYGTAKKSLSIDDYGNESITKEVKDYVRKEDKNTFFTLHKTKNKSYFEIK